jgi:hypothetical protein
MKMQKLVNRPKRMIATSVVILGTAAGLNGSTGPVYAPNSNPLGKTYAQWSAAWWQWADAMEITHHPMYDTAPIGTGQSGPVWFFGGHWANNSITTRTGAVPANVALMFMIEGASADNTGCPSPTSYEESYLRSSCTSAMNQSHDLTCTVDGLAVQNLLTAYRFQSPVFTFVTPPDNNILMDREGEPCYSNPAPGAPSWTVPGAVADGCYVMVAPLSPGTHSVHFTGQVGTFPFGIVEDITYNLISVSPVLSSSRQGSNLLLSWPKIGTNYVLEVSSSLTTTNWSKVSASVQTLSDRYQVSLPLSSGSQFFRLHN